MQNDAERKREPILVGVQWYQHGHVMQCHGVTNKGHAGLQGPTQCGGWQNLKNAEPLSEVRQKVLVLDSDFRKQEEGKVDYYAFMFLMALDSKQLMPRGCFCNF